MSDKLKPRAGCSGQSKPGLRTSARKKAQVAKIRKRLETGKIPLTRKQQKVYNRLLASANRVKAAKKKAAKEEVKKGRTNPEGVKQDKNGRWRWSNGHFVSKTEVVRLGL